MKNICKYCGKEFIRKPKQRYCSIECWKKEPNKKTTFKKGLVPYNKGKIFKKSKICIICKKEFLGKPKQKYCSLVCFFKSRRGAKHSQESKKKMSESRKVGFLEGRIQIRNKGTKGIQKAWNKGLKFSEESRKKMSESKKSLFSEGKLQAHNKGKPLSEETKRKLSKSLKGRKVWNKLPIPPKEELYDLYWIKNWPLSKIAESYNTNQNTALRWLRSHNISTREPFSKRKKPIFCKYGHKLQSHGEVNVCEVLDEENIPHESHIFYSKTRSRKFRTDFKIDENTFIEVKGASGHNSQYKKLKDEKFKEKENWLINSYLKEEHKGHINLYILTPNKHGIITKEMIRKTLKPLIMRHNKLNQTKN